MALTKEDLQAFQKLLEPINTRLDSMQTDIQQLNKNVAKIEVDHGQKLSALYDAHLDTVRHAASLQKLDSKVDDHDHRIFALEQKVSNR